MRATVAYVNWIGLWTLYRKEVRRFLKVSAQTVTGPVVTTLLFMVVFSVALGRGRVTVGGIPFLDFLAPGLIMMAMAQNAFANSSSSLLIAKIQGTATDLLMAPLGPAQLTVGLALGAATRGLLVAVVVAAAMAPFVRLGVAHPGFVLFHATAATLLMALAGVLAGLWAEKMDHLGAVTSFVVMPLTFLSGTFYSIGDLPEGFRVAAQLNPLFYTIDGFRYGFIGRADGSLAVGVAVMIGANLVLAWLCHRAFAAGWRLKP